MDLLIGHRVSYFVGLNCCFKGNAKFCYSMLSLSAMLVLVNDNLIFVRDNLGTFAKRRIQSFTSVKHYRTNKLMKSNAMKLRAVLKFLCLLFMKPPLSASTSARQGVSTP